MLARSIEASDDSAQYFVDASSVDLSGARRVEVDFAGVDLGLGRDYGAVRTLPGILIPAGAGADRRAAEEPIACSVLTPGVFAGTEFARPHLQGGDL